MTRCPRARSPISLALGRTRSVSTVRDDAAGPARAADFESAMTQQWYTNRRDGPTVVRLADIAENPRTRPRLVVRARSGGHAPVLPRDPRPGRDRHRQGGAHRVLLGRSTSP